MTGASLICPVCGYDKLRGPPWSDDGVDPSDEICPSCGIHFGYDDVAGGDAQRRDEKYAIWRAGWKARGCPWFSPNTPAPDQWDPACQLARLGGA